MNILSWSVVVSSFGGFGWSSNQWGHRTGRWLPVAGSIGLKSTGFLNSVVFVLTSQIIFCWSQIHRHIMTHLNSGGKASSILLNVKSVCSLWVYNFDSTWTWIFVEARNPNMSNSSSFFLTAHLSKRFRWVQPPDFSQTESSPRLWWRDPGPPEPRQRARSAGRRDLRRPHGRLRKRLRCGHGGGGGCRVGFRRGAAVFFCFFHFLFLEM